MALQQGIDALMMSMRKLSPGGYEYLTGTVACGDKDLEPGESLSDYYLRHGHPPGVWLGKAAEKLGVSGDVTREQMNAVFGEGRHPDADRIEADMLAAGASPEAALRATKLGYRFRQSADVEALRRAVIAAYQAYNTQRGEPVATPIDEQTRAQIRRGVQAAAFTEAHGGRQPSAQELNRWLATQKNDSRSAMAGYEFVFAPPKSVSIVWALSDETTRDLITGLHRQAVRDSVAFFESNAAFTRKGYGGPAQVDVQGVLAAAFEHWDSRAGDPHLHTHVCVSTKVQGPDGRWTSLDGRTVHAATVTVSEYYNSRIRDLLREHGARWTQQPQHGIDLKNPVWELQGVPRVLLAGFSRRAAAVEQERARGIVRFRRTQGREPTPRELLKISHRAQRDTRGIKRAPRSLTEHVRQWLREAETMVPSMGPLAARVFSAYREPLAHVNVEQFATLVRDTVSERFAHFTRWHLLNEAHRQTAHMRVEDREVLANHIADVILGGRETVALQPPAVVGESESLRRADGESVFVEHNARRYSTRRTLREEQDLTSWGGLRGGRRIPPAKVETALQRHQGPLNVAQRHAVTRFTRSGRRLELLLAPAGTGKTTTMRVLAESWRSAGGTVYAFGPSARAAQQLGMSIRARPHTLHQLTNALQRRAATKRFPFRRGDLVLIDEAAMAGTHTLHTVVEYALRRGADVRLVGDDRQLPAVEAGGAIRLFAHENGAVRLTEAVRFIGDPEQAVASLQLHAQDPVGLDYYFRRGWVEGGSRESMRDAAHRSWWRDIEAGGVSLLMTHENEDIAHLNRLAHESRCAGGLVDPRRATELHDGTIASPGDWIVTRDNQRQWTYYGGRDFVKNGDTWRVMKVFDDGSLRARLQGTGPQLVLPREYVKTHVELSYATTIHRAQGMTSDGSSHGVIVQGMASEQLYTLITRAIVDNNVYVETHQHTVDSHQETPAPRSAREVLENILARSSAELSATEQTREEFARSESLATLLAQQHHYLAHHDSEERIEAVLARHAPSVVSAPASEALQHTLRHAEDLGWQVEQVVPRLAHDLDGADDPAALMAWKVRQMVNEERPPPRIDAPDSRSRELWRGLVRQCVPSAAVASRQWDLVWQRAAAGATEGLDAGVAIVTAATALRGRSDIDPVPAYHYTAEAVTHALEVQRDTGAGWHPALPWMPYTDTTQLPQDQAEYLERLENAISNRAGELRTQIAAQPAAWTGALGPRPQDPDLAGRWDEIAGLGAAYRDTYGIHSNDPVEPLGPEPSGMGLRVRAWHDLLARWEPPTMTRSSRQPAKPDAMDRFREGVDPEELAGLVSAADPPVASRGQESLSVLAERHSIVSRALVNQASRAALAEHVPDVPVSAALLAVLRISDEVGWQADQLIGRVASPHKLSSADNPTSLLTWQLQQHMARYEPPARLADPDQDQIDHWQDLITHTAPGVVVTADAGWTEVWSVAAAAEREQLDADEALNTAAQQVAQRPGTDPVPDFRYVAQVVVDHLDEQRERGGGLVEQAAVPWLVDPHPLVQDVDPDLARQLQEVQEQAYERLVELRGEAAMDPPRWAASLGPRPDEATAAAEWDALVGLTAAYRETYDIRAGHPLGYEPFGDGPRTETWHDLLGHWLHALDDEPAADEDQHEHNVSDHSAAMDRFREGVDPEELAGLVSAADPPVASRGQESLSVLAERHSIVSRALVNQASRAALAEHVPDVSLLDSPAATALLATLRVAEEEGWQVDRLVGRVASPQKLASAENPGRVLIRQLLQHKARYEPPARLADPDQDQIDHWQDLITRTVPDADVAEDTWRVVWRIAAAAEPEGLDIDDALLSAAEQVQQHPATDRTDDFRYVAQVVVDHLDEQRERGGGLVEQAAVPWLVDPHPLVQDVDPDLARQLQEVQEQAYERLVELRGEAAMDPPRWAASLGPRPDEATAAAEWDALVGLTAAYRETYDIDGPLPLGPQPPSDDRPRAENWRSLSQNWASATAAHNTPTDDQRRTNIDAVRDRLDTHADDSHDDQETHRAALEDHDDVEQQHTERQDHGLGY